VSSGVDPTEGPLGQPSPTSVDGIVKGLLTAE
jgi:hypothetical protein